MLSLDCPPTPPPPVVSKLSCTAYWEKKLTMNESFVGEVEIIEPNTKTHIVKRRYDYYGISLLL